MLMTITNGLKKRRQIVQSSFYFYQLMIIKDRSLSYQKHAMESVEGSMKLHAVFPSTSNKLLVTNTSCFCKNCFGTSYKLETAYDVWIMVDLPRKRNPSILSNIEKTVEIPDYKSAVVPDINDHVAAGYDRKVYIGNLLEINDSDAKISFYEHVGTLSIGSFFGEPNKRDETWVGFINILYIVPVPAGTKREKKFEKFVQENVMEKFPVCKNKNWYFFLVLYCTRY